MPGAFLASAPSYISFQHRPQPYLGRLWSGGFHTAKGHSSRALSEEEEQLDGFSSCCLVAQTQCCTEREFSSRALGGVCSSHSVSVTPFAP